MPTGARFLVLEGIDGSGTTSQAAALAAALRDRGHTVLETREPSDGRAGRMARESLAVDAEPFPPAAQALLFAADRLDHVAGTIRPALEAGQVVICDRYVISSWVYQSLESDPEWVRAINRLAPWPDLTFVLQIDPALAFARVQARQAGGGAPLERFEVAELQMRLADGYAAVIREGLPGVHAIDARPSQAEVTALLLRSYLQYGL